MRSLHGLRSSVLLVVLFTGCTNVVDGSSTPLPPEPDGGAPAAEGEPGLRSFITSAKFTGDLTTQARKSSGLDAADALCQTAADGAGLGGRFIAYISSKTDDAVSRFTSEDGPFHQVDGRTVVFPTAAAVGGGATTKITTEKGGDLGIDDNFWTGSSAAGRASGKDCKGWTSASLFDDGSIASRFGDSDYDMACEGSYRLLCLEQRGAVPTRATKKVFVTSKSKTGAFGATRSAIEAADEVCAAAAKDGDVDGEFVAWLSARVDGKVVRAMDRISDARYVLLDGRVAFESKKDLAATPHVPIEINEFGAKVANQTPVWTGTLLGGAPATTVNCDNWTSSSINAWGMYGVVDGTTDYWTGGETEAERGAERCSMPMSFYCFER